jgi:hypothetical protein
VSQRITESTPNSSEKLRQIILKATLPSRFAFLSAFSVPRSRHPRPSDARSPSQNPLRASQKVRTPAPRQAVVPLPQILSSRRGNGSRRHTRWASMYRRQRTNQKNVGVGIMVAHDPLHGSGRADFPHPALTSGNDAHAAQRERMIDPRRKAASGRSSAAFVLAEDGSSGVALQLNPGIATVYFQSRSGI